MQKDFLKLVALLILLISYANYAQLTDLARLEYSFIPASQSEDQYTRLRALLNYPIKCNDTDYFILGGEYNRIVLNLEEPYPFDTNILDDLHIIDFNASFTFKRKGTWRFGVNINPRIVSTLTQKITFDDFFINGGVYMIKDKTKAEIEHPFRLIFGLTYNTTVGLPIPLPFISYFRKINDKWSYTAGVPKSNIKYRLTNKHSFQVFTSLDGYFANIQEPIEVNGQTADHISLSIIVGGLGYDYALTKHLIFYTLTGFTFRLNNVLRTESRDEVFRLNNLNAFYLRTGIKFKI